MSAYVSCLYTTIHLRVTNGRGWNTDDIHIVQEHEFENLVSFNTKSNQGLTSWDDGMDILEQHQVVCTIKLWYQKIFMGNFKEGACIDGTTSKIGICTHNCQYLCQYAIFFKILALKRNGFKGLCLCKKILQQCLSYEGQ